MKICRICLLEKEDNDCLKKQNICLPCNLIYHRNYKLKNKEHYKVLRDIYRKNNKESILKTNRKSFLKNKKKRNLESKFYKESHKEQIFIKTKEYNLKNKDIIKKRNNKTRYEKYHNNPIFRLHFNISVSIRYMLKANNATKNNSSKQYLPFSSNELINHIELLFSSKENLDKQNNVWMTWNNHGRFDSKIWNDSDISTWTWNLDHIIPQSDLPYDSMEHENFKKCWSLENLRPYSSKQNLLDGSTKIRHKENYYETQNTV